VYYLVTAGKSAPSKKGTERTCFALPCHAANEYLAHASGYWGGLYLEVREQFWPRHKAGDVGPFWSFLYGVFVHAYSEEAPEWMQIGTAAGEFLALGIRSSVFESDWGRGCILLRCKKAAFKDGLTKKILSSHTAALSFDLLRYEFLELEARRKRKMAQQGGATNPAKPDG